MDAPEFVACIGKTDDTPEVIKLLSDVGVAKKLKPSRDGTDVDVALKTLGIMMVFRGLDAKSSKLTLWGVQFYLNEGGYKPFKGALPQGLVFGDSRADVKGKLGKPLRAIKAIRRETWAIGNQELTVAYGKLDDRLSIVFQNLPIK
jgi:hypothetical protein